MPVSSPSGTPVLCTCIILVGVASAHLMVSGPLLAAAGLAVLACTAI